MLYYVLGLFFSFLFLSLEYQVVVGYIRMALKDSKSSISYIITNLNKSFNFSFNLKFSFWNFTLFLNDNAAAVEKPSLGIQAASHHAHGFAIMGAFRYHGCYNNGRIYVNYRPHQSLSSTGIQRNFGHKW